MHLAPDPTTTFLHARFLSRGVSPSRQTPPSIGRKKRTGRTGSICGNSRRRKKSALDFTTSIRHTIGEQIMKWPVLLLATLAITLGCLRTPSEASQVAKWTCWEHSLTSSRAYDNPLLDVVLNVRYTSPSKKTYDCYGFWDGDGIYRIRFMFNETGTWTWKTTCSDTGNHDLHARSGTVEVTAYEGTNPLYANGYLQVSDNGRYLVHANGKPFLWVGDTAWTANRFATDAEWKSYVNHRRTKRISVILVSCGWIGLWQKNAEGQRYFVSDVPLRVNPRAWQHLDHMIKNANQNGIVIMITSVGKANAIDKARAADRYQLVKYLVARYSGYHVILSPDQDCGGKFGDADPHTAGVVIDGAHPFVLITQHTKRNAVGRADPPGHPWFRTGLEWTLHYYHDPYLDIAGLQTGHGASILDGRPLIDAQDMELVAQDHITWVTSAYKEEPHKVLIVVEGLYEPNPDLPGRENGRRMVRYQGYWSFLAGACGYTSGTHGVWGWGNVDITWADPVMRCPPLADAIAYVYVDYLQHMASFFGSIEWWRLVPHNGRFIKNPSPHYRNKMLLAMSDTCDLAVAYLPDNEAIRIDMTAFAPRMKARWFHPVDGSWRDNRPAIVKNRASVTFVRPDRWQDAVLLLEAESVR